eukprot:1160464-Pelagomonas_calceolata.AAC.14
MLSGAVPRAASPGPGGAWMCKSNGLAGRLACKMEALSGLGMGWIMLSSSPFIYEYAVHAPGMKEASCNMEVRCHVGHGCIRLQDATLTRCRLSWFNVLQVCTADGSILREIDILCRMSQSMRRLGNGLGGPGPSLLAPIPFSSLESACRRSISASCLHTAEGKLPSFCGKLAPKT